MSHCLDIAVIAYNRPDKLHQCLLSLDLSRVHVFIDGPSNSTEIDAVLQCGNLCEDLDAVYTIRKANVGLAANIIMSVDHVLSYSETAIVVEDDVIVSPCAKEFLDRALVKFFDDEDVLQIGLYNPAATEHHGYVKLPRICSWGWATWRSRWATIKFNILDHKGCLTENKDKIMPDMYLMIRNQYEGQFTAWVARADLSRAINNQVVVYPSINLSRNFGADGSGINTPSTTKFDVNYSDTVDVDQLLAFEIPTGDIISNFQKFYTPSVKSRLRLWARNVGV